MTSIEPRVQGVPAVQTSEILVALKSIHTTKLSNTSSMSSISSRNNASTSSIPVAPPPKVVCFNSPSSKILRMFSAKTGEWHYRNGTQIVLNMLRKLRVLRYCLYFQCNQYQRTRYCQYLQYPQGRILKYLKQKEVCTVSSADILRIQNYPQY